MIENKTDTIVVTGRNYCNILTMARAFGKAGYNVEVLRVFKTKPGRINVLRRMNPEAYSKYVTKYIECIENNDPDRIPEALLSLADGERRKMLIPVDDYLVGSVDNNLDRLKDRFIIPSIAGRAGEISRLMDKNQQKNLAAAYDLPLLQSALVKSQDGSFEIPDDISYPCFIKPNISMNSTKSKMRKCADRGELEKVLGGYAQNGDFEMLVEEYADIKTEYSILGVCAGGKAAAPCVFKVVEGGNRERKGVTLTGEIVPGRPFKEIIDECCRFMCGLDYDGLFDIDLIETRDGKLYFIEVNFRAGASMHVFTETGINLPEMYADVHLKGKILDPVEFSDAAGTRFISEKVLMEEYARSDADMKKVRKCMDEADVYFVKDAHDMEPYKYFNKFYKAAAMLRLPYRIRDYIRT